MGRYFPTLESGIGSLNLPFKKCKGLGGYTVQGLRNPTEGVKSSFHLNPVDKRILSRHIIPKEKARARDFWLLTLFVLLTTTLG